MPRTFGLGGVSGLRGCDPKYGFSCCVPSASCGNVCSMNWSLLATTATLVPLLPAAPSRGWWGVLRFRASQDSDHR
jgi:hypothetical protein